MDATDLYDVIVAGGGLSGISAAIGSARLGARTLLIERYGFLGGLATAGLVNPFMSWQTSTGKPLVGGIFTELCERMDSMDGMLGGAFDPEIMKYVTQEMVLESGAELLQHSAVIDVHVDKNKISRLSVEEKSGICDLRSKIVIDATGDADVAAMAGVDYELGDPATGATQAMTLMFTLGDVDIRKSLVYAMENPAEMRFPKPTSDHEIDKMLESAVGIAGFYAKVEEARSKREFPLQQDMVFFISLPMPRQVIVNTTHIGNVDGTSSEDLTRAEVEGRRQAISLVKFFREYIPGFENTYLLQTAAQVGIRETRRITGEYIFSAQDVIAARKFPDAVLRSAYPVDVHTASKGYTRGEERQPPSAPPPGDWYEVPYRCLLPKTIDNLLVAGRCISASHEGQGAVRIMPNCIALGQAAGTAAALSLQERVMPRQLNPVLLKSILVKNGALL